jgi:hypothetical protein
VRHHTATCWLCPILENLCPFSSPHGAHYGSCTVDSAPWVPVFQTTSSTGTAEQSTNPDSVLSYRNGVLPDCHHIMRAHLLHACYISQRALTAGMDVHG